MQAKIKNKNIISKLRGVLDEFSEEDLKKIVKLSMKNKDARLYLKLLLDTIKVIYAFDIIEDDKGKIQIIIQGAEKIKEIKTNKDLFYKEK